MSDEEVPLEEVKYDPVSKTIVTPFSFKVPKDISKKNR